MPGLRRALLARRLSLAALQRSWVASHLFRLQRELQRRHAVGRRGRARVAGGSEPCRVTLCRVIGNDLFPRHQHGQALANLRTILRDEGHPQGWHKLFIVNRMVDPGPQAEAVAAIRAAGHDCLVIPFDPQVYQSLRYRPEAFGGLTYFDSSGFADQDPFLQDRQRLWACAEKIRYLMNINGARNVGLAAGRSRSHWTLVLDGSCLLPDRTFSRLQQDLESCPAAAYWVIPMRRLTGPYDPAAADWTPTDQEEPQIAFHRDAAEQFDEAYPYGLRDKTSLLNRLGVPGPWSAWAPLAFHADRLDRCPDRHCYGYASASVLRLPSAVGISHLESSHSQPARYRARITAIFRALELVDRRCGAPDAAVLAGIIGGSRLSSLEPSSGP